VRLLNGTKTPSELTVGGLMLKLMEHDPNLKVEIVHLSQGQLKMTFRQVDMYKNGEYLLVEGS
jgi:hypothetical protein